MIPTRKEHRIPVVYKITNIVNGKIYVGSSLSFYKRYLTYKKNVNTKPARQMVVEKAMIKYGMENFFFEILEKVQDKSKILEREQYWIDTLCPFDPFGYNINKRASSRMGMKTSLETRAKMSETRKERMASGEIKKSKSRPILQIEKGTLKILAEFSSSKEAARHFGTERSAGITLACSGKQVSAKGFYWCWKNEYEKNGFSPREYKSELKSNPIPKKIGQFDLKGNLIKVWESIREVSRYFGCSNATISLRCNEKQDGDYKGFIWKFA